MENFDACETLEFVRVSSKKQRYVRGSLVVIICVGVLKNVQFPTPVL